MSKLIHKSLLSGTFPNFHKTAKVVPVFKAESRILCSNYRPIFLLSNTGKIIEKLIYGGQSLPIKKNKNNKNKEMKKCYSEKNLTKLSWPVSAKSDKRFFIQKEKKNTKLSSPMSAKSHT